MNRDHLQRRIVHRCVWSLSEFCFAFMLTVMLWSISIDNVILKWRGYRVPVSKNTLICENLFILWCPPFRFVRWSLGDGEDFIYCLCQSVAACPDSTSGKSKTGLRYHLNRKFKGWTTILPVGWFQFLFWFLNYCDWSLGLMPAQRLAYA